MSNKLYILSPACQKTQSPSLTHLGVVRPHKSYMINKRCLSIPHSRTTNCKILKISIISELNNLYRSSVKKKTHTHTNQVKHGYTESLKII